jgi:hypothetical protein
MLRAFIVFWILLLGTTRASEFTVAATGGLFTFGGQVGWESDERIGVRISVGYEVLGSGLAVNAAAYQAFGKQVDVRLGAGIAWLRDNISGTTTDYFAVAGLLAILIPLEDTWSLLYEFLPTLVIYRNNTAPTLFDMAFRLDEILVSQVNVGFAYRF